VGADGEEHGGRLVVVYRPQIPLHLLIHILINIAYIGAVTLLTDAETCYFSSDGRDIVIRYCYLHSARWTTKSMEPMSIPSSRVDVQTSPDSFPCLKLSSTLCRPPWRESHCGRLSGL